MKHIIVDNGCRRSGIERRQISYDKHIPERRSGEDDRRSDNDRRSRKDRRIKPITSK
jgi:hypothetical protein